MFYYELSYNFQKQKNKLKLNNLSGQFNVEMQNAYTCRQVKKNKYKESIKYFILKTFEIMYFYRTKIKIELVLLSQNETTPKQPQTINI